MSKSTPGPEKRQVMSLDELKAILSPEETPITYSGVYKTVITADNGSRHPGGLVYADEVKKILATAGLSSAQQDSIFQLTFSAQPDPSSGGLQEVEFDILLALVGLAQAGYEPTFDVIDEKRNSLPTPKIGYINDLRPSDDAQSSRPNTSDHVGDARLNDNKKSKDDGGNEDSSIGAITSTTIQTRPNTSFTLPDIDPWGEDSATVPRTAPHLTTSMTAPPGSNFGGRFHSPFGDGDKKAGLGNMSSSSTGFQPPLLSSRPTFGSGAWADAFPAQSFLDPTSETFAGGFEQVSADRTQTGANNLSRTLGGGSKVPAPKEDEIISIIMLPEKEGMFMFQHRNYEVKSSRRGSSVIRRYSDFVWLHDCLIKKYPFRQIPLLPPKRVAVNGTHLAADSASFLDKRRRGLIRFANALVQHPVLSQEQLVVMFLTVPTELSVWRKQATVSVQEEFVGKVVPPELEDALPPTLSETFEVVRSGIKRSAEIYINLCNLFDRYARRCEGLGAEQYRIARSLQNLTDCLHDTYAADNKDVPMLNLGISATARHLMASQGLLEDETAAWNEGVLEDLKRQRDGLVAMRDMFDRRDKYARDNIAQLEGRIANNQKKLRDLKAKPEGAVKPTEFERVECSIMADKTSIVQQHERGILIKECVRDELLYFQVSQYHISRLHQDWSQERVKYAELQASNWRSMAEDVETMPSRE